jgi:hypothetical protein
LIRVLRKTNACGMGYPGLGLPCLRRRGHSSFVSPCFSVRGGRGFWLYQDGRDSAGPEDRWPDDIWEEPDEKI